MTSRRAFTLIELTLAMVITSVIGLSIAGVSLALSDSYARSQDYYASLQCGRSTISQMQDTLRRARLITGATDQALIFWAQDEEGSDAGYINKAEIKLWVYDSANSQIRQCCIAYPASQKSLLNTRLTLSQVTVTPSTNCIATTDAYSQWTVIATDVKDFHIRLDQAAPLTKCVMLDITIGGSTNAASAATNTRFQNAVRLRADATSLVTQQNGQYVLSAP